MLLPEREANIYTLREGHTDKTTVAVTQVCVCVILTLSRSVGLAIDEETAPLITPATTLV